MLNKIPGNCWGTKIIEHIEHFHAPPSREAEKIIVKRMLARGRFFYRVGPTKSVKVLNVLNDLATPRICWPRGTWRKCSKIN